MLFVGDDWAEDHHDVEVQDGTGRRLGTARLEEGIAGIDRLHTLLATHTGPDADPDRWSSASRPSGDLGCRRCSPPGTGST